MSSQLSLPPSLSQSLTKYCFRLEGHGFRVRGAHPRPVYVPTFHLHAVYLGKQNGMPACLCLFRQTEGREQEMPPMVLGGIKSSTNQDANIFFWDINSCSDCLETEEFG